MSQSSPVNPLAILDLRDYLLRDGMNVNDLTKVCCLDPSYEKLLSCVLSTEAKNQLLFFLNLLALKLSRVVMSPYIIEMISKKPQEIQVDIVKSIFESISDDAILNDRDFVFLNPDQIRMYVDLYKKPEDRNAIIFEEEMEDIEDNQFLKQNKTKRCSANISKEKRREADVIVGDVPHMAVLDLGNKRYRINWKNKTFSEVHEQKNDGFVILRGTTQLQKIYSLSSKQIKLLRLSEGIEPYYKIITDSKQLRFFADKFDEESELRGIFIFNRKIMDA
jgi:hypothetical protein